MLVNPVPPPQRTSLEMAPLPSTSSSSSSTPPSAHPPTTTLPVELRWGIESAQQRSMWDMHERNFAAKYDDKFYIDLFASAEENGFISLCLYTTPRAYTTASRAYRRAYKDAISTPVTEEAENAILSKLTVTERVEYSRPPMPPFEGNTPDQIEADMKRKSDISELLLQLEYIAKQRAEKEAKAKGTAATTPGATTAPLLEKEETGVDEEDAYTVLIGFAIGSLGYARQAPPPQPQASETPAAASTASTSSPPSSSSSPPPRPRKPQFAILTNPTGYLGSFAVDEHVRRHGVGTLMLEHFLRYVTTQLPVRASYFLHYTKQGMLSLLRRTRPDLFHVEKDFDALKAQLQAERDRQKLDRIARDCGMMPPISDQSSPTTLPGLYQFALQLCPPLYNLYEDRCARRILREKHHLSEAQVTEARLFAKNGINWVQNQSFADRARAEMAALESELNPVLQHGVNEVWLNCNTNEPHLRAYYTKRGFTLQRVVHGFYDFNGVKADGDLLVYQRPATDPQTQAKEGDPTAPAVNLTALAEAQRTQASSSQQKKATTATIAAQRPKTTPNSDAGADDVIIAHKKDDDAAVPADAHVENATEEGATPPPASPPRRMRWLLPSEYDRVVHIDLLPIERCRQLYRQQTEDESGDPGTARRRQVRSVLSFIKELALTLNALALLGYVCYIAYRFSTTGKFTLS